MSKAKTNRWPTLCTDDGSSGGVGGGGGALMERAGGGGEDQRPSIIETRIDGRGEYNGPIGKSRRYFLILSTVPDPL